MLLQAMYQLMRDCWIIKHLIIVSWLLIPVTGTGIDSLGSTNESDPRSYQVTSLSYTHHVSVGTMKRSLKRCRTLTKVSLRIYYSHAITCDHISYANNYEYSEYVQGRPDIKWHKYINDRSGGFRSLITFVLCRLHDSIRELFVVLDEHILDFCAGLSLESLSVAHWRSVLYYERQDPFVRSFRFKCRMPFCKIHIRDKFPLSDGQVNLLILDVLWNLFYQVFLVFLE